MPAAPNDVTWSDVFQLDMIVGLLGTPSAEDLRTVCEAARAHMRRKSSRPSNLLSLYRLSRDSDHDVVSLLSSIFVFNPVCSCNSLVASVVGLVHNHLRHIGRLSLLPSMGW